LIKGVVDFAATGSSAKNSQMSTGASTTESSSKASAGVRQRVNLRKRVNIKPSKYQASEYSNGINNSGGSGPSNGQSSLQQQ